MTIKRTLIDSTIEEQIVTGMITSTKFLTEIKPLYTPDSFQSFIAKYVGAWCIDYFEQYEEAPGKCIEDIYNIESEHLGPENKELIGIYLSKISKRYEKSGEINIDYVQDNAFRFFKKRALEIDSVKMQSLLVMDRVEEAEEIMTGYKKITIGTEGFCSPFEPRKIMDVFFDDDRDYLKLNGALGELIGKIERGWTVALTAPFKTGKCLIKGSLITMSDGAIKPIETIIKNKDFTVSKNEHDNFVFNKVLDVVKQGVKWVYQVKTRTGRETEVTIDHPFYSSKGWLPLSQLFVGNHIAVPRRYPILGTKRYPEYRLKILAYLIAEGCFRSNGSYTFTNKCSRIQKDFKNCIKMMGDKITQESEMTVRVICEEEGRGRVGGSNTRKWITSLGLHQKLSKEKTIPDFVFQLNNQMLSVFLSVLFTCDGSVFQVKNNIAVSYSSASKKLVYQVQHLLLRFGIIGAIQKNIFKGFYSWELEFQDTINVNRYLSEIGFLFEKQERAENIIKNLNKKRCAKSNIEAIPFEVIKEIIPYELRWKSNAVGQSFKKKGKISRSRLSQITVCYPDNEKLQNLLTDDILWDEIVEITCIGEKETYDLVIENNHNFISNDIIVHNSWFLLEVAVQAYFKKFKSLIVSLEMSEKYVNDRLLKRLTALGNRESEETCTYPVFDCLYNQDNSCERKERTNRINLKRNGVVPHYDVDMEYRPCTYCREQGLKDYKVETWFESIGKRQYKQPIVKKEIDAIQKMYGDGIQIKTYPRFSASLHDIETHLHKLEQKLEFIPDIILIDYVDILKPLSKKESYMQIDDTWKEAVAMAQKHHCTLFTVGQVNRGGLGKPDVDDRDSSGWIGKLAHVDVQLTLSRPSEDKRAGTARVAVTEHRYKAFDRAKQALILQQLDIGQFALDSEIIWRNL